MDIRINNKIYLDFIIINRSVDRFFKIYKKIFGFSFFSIFAVFALDFIILFIKNIAVFRGGD